MYKRQKPKHYNTQSGNEAYLCIKNASCNWQWNLTILISVMSNTLLCFLLFIRKIFWYREKHFAMLIVSINFHNLCSGELSRLLLQVPVFTITFSAFTFLAFNCPSAVIILSFYYCSGSIGWSSSKHQTMYPRVRGIKQHKGHNYFYTEIWKSSPVPKISIPRMRYIITQAFL